MGKKIEGDLIDHVAEAASKEARPLGDTYLSATSRRTMVKALVKEAAIEALAMIKKGAV